MLQVLNVLVYSGALQGALSIGSYHSGECFSTQLVSSHALHMLLPYSYAALRGKYGVWCKYTMHQSCCRDVGLWTYCGPAVRRTPSFGSYVCFIPLILILTSVLVAHTTS